VSYYLEFINFDIKLVYENLKNDQV